MSTLKSEPPLLTSRFRLLIFGSDFFFWISWFKFCLCCILLCFLMSCGEEKVYFLLNMPVNNEAFNVIYFSKWKRISCSLLFSCVLLFISTLLVFSLIHIWSLVLVSTLVRVYYFVLICCFVCSLIFICSLSLFSSCYKHYFSLWFFLQIRPSSKTI